MHIEDSVFLEPVNCSKLGEVCTEDPPPFPCCPGLKCHYPILGRPRCKAGGGGKACKPKNSPCVKASDCCSKRCKKYGTGKKCA